MVETTTLVELVKTAKEVVSWKSLETYRKRFLYHIQNGQIVMPVLGAGGVGKTTFSNIMQGVNPFDLDLEYKESIKVEKDSLSGFFPVDMHVFPGQKFRTYSNISSLQGLITQPEPWYNKKKIVIVNVVSYGYHSLQQDSFKDNDHYDGIMNENEFLKIHLEKRKIIEIDDLEQIFESISKFKKQITFITLITKQDLWYDKREEVLKFYKEGAYSKLISKSNVNEHYIIPVSLAISNLTTNSGEILAQSVQGYDFATYLRYLGRMHDNITKILEV